MPPLTRPVSGLCPPGQRFCRKRQWPLVTRRAARGEDEAIGNAREAGMPDIVRAALVQQAWTGDKDSMIAAALRHIHAAADAGAQVVCLQELFYGPYFCQVQHADYYSFTEAIP